MTKRRKSNTNARNDIFGHFDFVLVSDFGFRISDLIRDSFDMVRAANRWADLFK